MNSIFPIPDTLCTAVHLDFQSSDYTFVSPSPILLYHTGTECHSDKTTVSNFSSKRKQLVYDYPFYPSSYQITSINYFSQRFDSAHTIGPYCYLHHDTDARNDRSWRFSHYGLLLMTSAPTLLLESGPSLASPVSFIFWTMVKLVSEMHLPVSSPYTRALIHTVTPPSERWVDCSSHITPLTPATLLLVPDNPKMTTVTVMQNRLSNPRTHPFTDWAICALQVEQQKVIINLLTVMTSMIMKD